MEEHNRFLKQSPARQDAVLEVRFAASEAVLQDEADLFSCDGYGEADEQFQVDLNSYFL